MLVHSLNNRFCVGTEEGSELVGLYVWCCGCDQVGWALHVEMDVGANRTKLF